MGRFTVVQGYDMSSSKLAQLLDEGYEIKAIVPKIESHSGSQLFTRILYVLVKDNSKQIVDN